MSSGPRGRGESARRGNTGFIPPGYLAKHSKHGPFNLATEAKETVKAVKKLLEVERKFFFLFEFFLAAVFSF